MMRYQKNIEMAFSPDNYVQLLFAANPSRDLNFNTVNFAPAPELYRKWAKKREKILPSHFLTEVSS